MSFENFEKSIREVLPRSVAVQGTGAGSSRPATGPTPWVTVRCWLVRTAPVLFLCIFAITFRSPHFGSPDVDYDEPFYLLVGDQMLNGALPYVDIWDRKPIGLFLIYAAIRLLFGGEGFTQYLVVAALFAGITSCFVWSIAIRYVSRWAAVLPALFYIVWQEPYSGGGGQSAIFYNLLTIGGIWLAIRSKDGNDAAATARRGWIAMLLFGLAIQVKYTVLPEGVFVGLTFLVLLLRQGLPLPKIAMLATGYGALALAPTALAGLVYLALGHFDAFYYANFVSIFDRAKLDNGFIHYNVTYIAVVAVPLAICAALGLARLLRSTNAQHRSDAWLLGGWTLAATISFVMIGNYYHYYFMTMLLPLAVLTAPLFTEFLLGGTAATLLIWWPVVLSAWPQAAREQRTITSIAKLTQMVAPLVRDRCLYVFDGPTALYMTTRSCLPTRYAYPDHLSNDVERTALGVDAAVEMRRVLASRPGAIVTSPTKLVPILNQPNLALLRAALQRDYRLVGSLRHKHRVILVYGLRPIAQRQITGHTVATALAAGR
jgi:hypothetical protein